VNESKARGDTDGTVVRDRLRILLVDDEEVMRTSLTLTLRNEGFLVEPCEGPARANEQLKTRDFDVLITDIHMDDMDGCHLAALALSRRPGMRVIYMSAYEFPPECGTWPRLAKPFRTGALLALLREMHPQTTQEVR
jgi:DNA-binding NtrC family response regulator